MRLSFPTTKRLFIKLNSGLSDKSQTSVLSTNDLCLVTDTRSHAIPQLCYATTLKYRPQLLVSPSSPSQSLKVTASWSECPRSRCFMFPSVSHYQSLSIDQSLLGSHCPVVTVPLQSLPHTSFLGHGPVAASTWCSSRSVFRTHCSWVADSSQGVYLSHSPLTVTIPRSQWPRNPCFTLPSLSLTHSSVTVSRSPSPTVSPLKQSMHTVGSHQQLTLPQRLFRGISSRLRVTDKGS